MTGPEFRAALLGFVRNQHDRPKAKEADSLRLSQLLRPTEPGKRLLARRFGLLQIGLTLHSPG